MPRIDARFSSGAEPKRTLVAQALAVARVRGGLVVLGWDQSSRRR